MPQTHFGYTQVDAAEKAGKVAGVFHSVAKNYDVMNDLMSGGLHRGWKLYLNLLANIQPGMQVLDIASGTGDLAKSFAKKVGATGNVWSTDINASMLAVGRDRLMNEGLILPMAIADAEKLPFKDNHFDFVSVAFGLRNMTDKDAALKEMCRVLKPTGRLAVLEFSRVNEALKPIYDTYSFKVLPWLGEKVAGDADSYRYLAESIRMHPDQETLKAMMLAAGFDKVEYHNLTAGVVALHIGTKL